MRKFLYALVLVLALSVSALAGPPEMPGYEGQQVVDSDGITWIWRIDSWRLLND